MLVTLMAHRSAGWIFQLVFVSPASPPSSLRAVRRAQMVSDDTVPEAHKGLHNSLYGEGAEAAHAAATKALGWPGQLDGSELLDTAEWVWSVREISPEADLQLAIGLFALYESPADDSPWIVGLSRRVQSDIARLSTERGSFVRVRLLGLEPRMWTRAKLEEERQKWAEELGFDDRSAALPVSSATSAEGVDSEEFRAYEERKWKMQMAMGQNLFDAAENEAEQDLLRRQNFIRAVEGDDWSAVISEQSAETEAVPETFQAPIASPFSLGHAHLDVDEIPRELTASNVRAVLEAVRPILLADGGDIEVIGVSKERGAVMLGLMGACETCPAAPQTMESGVEKVLMDHFGRDVLKEIVRVDQGAAASSPEGVRQSVEAHLAELQDSLSSEGGQAFVRECQSHGCVVEFSGPPMLRELVKSSLSYRFPQLSNELVAAG